MIQRLQKIISAAGIASRRTAETMILEGRVTVNGKQAELGMSADPDADEICVDGEPVSISRARHYIILNKPRGYVSTMSDERGRPTVAELTESAGRRLYPVGRLDMDSEGLLILTNDGAAANALMHPKHEVNKVYSVFVQGESIKESLRELQSMDSLEGESIRPPQAMLIELRGKNAELQITIHEGKNRQIRRMCKACGMHVTRLVRIAEGALLLGDLPSGRWRYMTKDEVSYLHDLAK